MFVKNTATLVAALSLLASVDARRQQLNERGTRCNGDNLLNRFRGSKYSDAAISFCQTFINSVTYSVVTVSTDDAHVSSPVTTYSTAYPTPLLTTSYPASRLSSACSCVSPSVITAVVTEYVASTPAATSDDATTSTADDSPTITADPTTDPTSSTDGTAATTDDAATTATDDAAPTLTDDPATSTDDAATTSTDSTAAAPTDDSATTTDDTATTSTDDSATTATDESVTSPTVDTSATATEDPTSAPTDDPTASPTEDPTTSATSDPTSTDTTSSPTSTPAAPTNLGCYVEGPGGRALKNLVLADDGLTIEACAAAAASYAFYGVEFGRECWADNALDRTAFLSLDQTVCDMACGGDPAQTCGGSSTINIYGLPDDTTGAAPESPYTSLGCFAEPDGARALPQVYASNKMTVELCHQTCSLAGYAYAGLEYSVECWCGNTVPQLAAADGACTAACGGDASETCGGNNALQLYSAVAAS